MPQRPASATQARLALLAPQRADYQGLLLRRFWLRFHMTLMLVATVGAGVLANRLLLGVSVLAAVALVTLVAGVAAGIAAPGARTLGEILMLYR